MRNGANRVTVSFGMFCDSLVTRLFALKLLWQTLVFDQSWTKLRSFGASSQLSVLSFCFKEILVKEQVFERLVSRLRLNTNCLAQDLVPPVW